ncbi:unnamed protein product [Choristocarpus tenellus]
MTYDYLGSEVGVHVSRVETLALAKSKAWFELGYTFMAVVVAAFAGGQGERFLRFGAILCSRPEVLLVVGLVAVWNGVVTSAYAMWAQTRGQAVVAPSEANLVYSIQPLWSTLFAVVLLKVRGEFYVCAGSMTMPLFLPTIVRLLPPLCSSLY